MNTNTGPTRWILPVLVSAAAFLWSGCSTTPKSDGEPAAEADQASDEAPAARQEPQAEAPVAADPGPAARTLSPSGTVVPIEPFSRAYYAEMIRAIEGGLRPLSSIPAPIGSQPRLHEQR